ncbi:MAG: hypothetical protein EBT15_07320 [Betaproteobacteria bacterium]|nr:hypothetical protein [Betaproteobacteria bacterium]
MSATAALFTAQVRNRNPHSEYEFFEIETVVEWSDERGDLIAEAVKTIEDLDGHLETYCGSFCYGVYGRTRDGLAEHINDFPTPENAIAFVRKLNGKENT